MYYEDIVLYLLLNLISYQLNLKIVTSDARTDLFIYRNRIVDPS